MIKKKDKPHRKWSEGYETGTEETQMNTNFMTRLLNYTDCPFVNFKKSLAIILWNFCVLNELFFNQHSDFGTKHLFYPR